MSFLSPKYMTSSIVCTCLRVITVASLPPSFAFTFSLLSSSPSQTPQPIYNNVISEFLLNECGFCPSELTKVFSRRALLRTRSAHTAKEAVQFLRDSGFTQDQLKKIIVGCPSILSYKVDGQMKLKLEFLKTLGFAAEELPNFICRAPRLLSCNIENHLLPTANYLESLFGSKINLEKALRRSPTLMACNIQKQLIPKLDLLKHYGSIQGELFSLLILQSPNILHRYSVEALKSKMEYVDRMGILQGSKAFVYALITVAKNRPENLERKIKYMASFGLLEEEIHEVTKKFPEVLKYSTNKIQENMNFLIHTARLPPNIVVAYPFLFSCSVEKRLKPRHEVFKALSSMKQITCLPSLVYIFKLSERKFLQRFLECNLQASPLSEIYKGKSSNLTIR